MNKVKTADIIVYVWCEKCDKESEVSNELFGPDWVCPKCGKNGAEKFFRKE